MAPGRRIASLAAIIGLLGSGMAMLALTSAPGGSPFGQRLSFGGRPLRLPRGPAAAGTSAGMRLLSEAAAACQDAAYRGSQVLRWWGQDGTSQLPGNLSLLTAAAASTRSGPVVNLSYSDGLVVVSVFVQRGELAHAPPGWRPVTLSGRTVYSVNPEDRTFAWSAGGFVYTLVADAPLETVSLVVAALPSTSAQGFWQRMVRGLHRIVSWINPLR